MTQEDNDLLIKDLCARLPYGTIVQMQLPLGKIDTNLDYNVMYNIENGNLSIKPYLFKMSSMTEKQKEEFRDIVFNNLNDTCSTYDWFNAHHFDYRGLIEKGLAIDATDLNIY